MGWIDLTQDREGWRELMLEAMKLRVHKMQGIS
jgi:hypothetical protein